MASKKFKKGSLNLKKAWSEAKKEARKTGDFLSEPMTGLFKLVSAKTDTIGDSDWQHVAFRFVCVDPDEFAGKIHIHRCGLSEQSLPFLIRDLARLGIDADDLEITSLEDLDEALLELSSKQLIVRAQCISQKDSDFLNMRIKRVVDIDPDEFEEEEEEKEEEEEEEDEDEDEEGEEDGDANETEDEDEDEVEDEEEEDEDEDEVEEEEEIVKGLTIYFDRRDKDGKPITLKAKVFKTPEQEDDTVDVKVGRKKYTVPIDEIYTELDE